MSSKTAGTVTLLLVLCAAGGALSPGAAAEQAAEPTSPAAGQIDAGVYHTCALLSGGSVRCWGFGADGQLGYGNTNTIGDDETPGSVGPVNLGVGRTAKAISAGDSHTCALLDDATVRCWGLGADGRLGYANTQNVGDDETPGSVGPVNLGGRATAISAGGAHTCAVLDDGTVRCWGFGADGRLGYGRGPCTPTACPTPASIGDNEAPGSVGPVNLGTGHTAKAISAGKNHTCALLEDDTVRCWGVGGNGQLGYASSRAIGDDETPGSAGPVDIGLGHKAVAISAGAAETCAVLDDGNVRCWGYGGNGRLGYANTTTIGDDETPGSVGPVDLGADRKALAISVGDGAACARLDDASLRCWGLGGNGQLGYANTNDIGDNETPGSGGPVDLGGGRMALAVTAAKSHTCARLDGGDVRCWGLGANGRLGYCNQDSIGDDETPGAAGPVDLGEPGRGGAGCASPPSVGGSPTIGSTAAPVPGAEVDADAARARGLRDCLAAVAGHTKHEQSLARRGSARQRAKARRHLGRHATTRRRRCLRLYARTPGRVTAMQTRALGRTQIELSFNAPGSNGSHPPPARSYVFKQSLRPIRSARSFARAQTLCKGACRFTVSRVGGRVSLTVTDLRPHTTYYYAVAARDNVSGHRGPSSQAQARTR